MVLSGASVEMTRVFVRRMGSDRMMQLLIELMGFGRDEVVLRR
jgi:hypothetical protein